MELKICHLYPDVMNLSCDRGNLICMEKRLCWRGIGVDIVPVHMGDVLHADDFDLIFIGNGQPFVQPLLMENLRQHRPRPFLPQWKPVYRFLPSMALMSCWARAI